MPDSQARPDVSLTRLLGTFWTAANMLSLIRLALAVPITYLILLGEALPLLMGLIAAAVLTDWLDGQVARWSKTVSSWGKVLDPLADKVMAALIVMALVAREVEPALPLWFLILIVVRDVCIVGGGTILARRTGRVVMSLWAGKVAVALLSLTVFAALLRADPPVIQALVWMTTALLLYSFARYLVRFCWLLYAGAPAPEAPERDDRRSERAAQPPAQNDPVGPPVRHEAESLR